MLENVRVTKDTKTKPRHSSRSKIYEQVFLYWCFYVKDICPIMIDTTTSKRGVIEKRYYLFIRRVALQKYKAVTKMINTSIEEEGLCMNDCFLQSSQDWHLQRMYMKKFNKLVLVKSVHHNSAETRAKLQYEFSLFSNEQNLGY